MRILLNIWQGGVTAEHRILNRFLFERGVWQQRHAVDDALCRPSVCIHIKLEQKRSDATKSRSALGRAASLVRLGVGCLSKCSSGSQASARRRLKDAL